MVRQGRPCHSPIPQSISFILESVKSSIPDYVMMNWSEVVIRNRSRILAASVIIVILCCALGFIYVFNGHSLDLTARHMTLVASDSMDGDVHEFDIDSFPANTLVMEKMLSQEDERTLKDGDVISYRKDGTLEYGRIIAIDHGTALALVQGDNRSSSDNVYMDEVDGLVVGTSPFMGELVNFVRSNSVLIIITIAILAAAIVLISFRRRDQ